ncbi:MAG: D-alanyl-D-alanine carboxypeptidase/D-alanyl-D-alanine-endopeptidase [Candidatus Eremiobacteraeota bacterium]|nr:D-alanyl-D-alanine carboxypeptidase/D-alanyl-D-alanine-endopeptidase [Candidatus Eremiobacteraeota bacterium]
MHQPHVATVASRPAPTPAPSAPPAHPWAPAELARARTMLEQTFAPVIGAGDRASLVVIGGRGETIYSFGASNVATPASVQKLIVAYSSLNLLGPSYRFHTLLAADHPIGSDGALDGNLWLVGSGDPSFRSSDLQMGVAALRRAGLTRIDGGVAIDATAIKGPEINPRWSAADAGEDFQTPVSGVSLDGDTEEFRVYGTAPGETARVVVIPKSSDIRMYGTVTTSSGADSVVIAPMDANTFALSGYIPAGIEEKFWLPVHNIPRHAGDALQAMLEQSGIHTSSPPSSETAPLDSIVLWEHRSAPLPSLVTHMLYVSDNHFAEQLLRTIGGDAGGNADDQSGIAAELVFLRSRSIPTPGIRLYDGSGLAEANRVSAVTLAHILSDAELRGNGEELYPLLPGGGRDGTLKYYHFTTARVRAKTGHLSDADSLAGYVDTKRHGRLAFAFMINDSPGDPDDAYVHALDSLSQF